jgi:PKHD-type hydroxylase
MLLNIPKLLSADSLAHCRALIDHADWVDGRVTAGTQSTTVKRNQQLPAHSAAAREAQQLVLVALNNNGLFLSGALPNRVFPPLFNRYATGMDFGSHVDNAIRTHEASGQHIRTDISVTVFLSAPDEYDGGELVIEDTFGSQSAKLAAGDAILYPSSSVHRVQPVTRGVRTASFFWVESRVREPDRRRLLFDMDTAIVAMRASRVDQGGSADMANEDVANDDVIGKETIRLTSCYHNLLRMWANS